MITFGESGPLDETLFRLHVPPHLHEGLIAYITTGRPTGGFLYSVLSNDLKQAVNTADTDSAASIYSIVKWLYLEAPSQCWGSQEKVQAWLLKKHEERQGKQAV